VGVQEVRWDIRGTVRAGDCNFFYGKGNENHKLGTGFFFVHDRIASAVKRVEFKLVPEPSAVEVEMAFEKLKKTQITRC